jgi:hypothetical protein
VQPGIASPERLLRGVSLVGYGVAAAFYGLVLALELGVPSADWLALRLALIGALVVVGALVAVRGVQRLARAHFDAVDRARIAGVHLAIRTAEHELNNSLALTVGNAEMLAVHPDLPADARALAAQSLKGAELAADAIRRMSALEQVREVDWGPMIGSTLDLSKQPVSS